MEKSHPSIAIIGAGLSGICLALDLERKGCRDYVIYERDDAVGADGRELGITTDIQDVDATDCSVAAVVYSHSRHPNPNWAETHPLREQIHQYWTKLAEDQGLMPKIRLGHAYVKGVWNVESAAWDVTFNGPQGGYTVRHKMIVSAIGGFSEPLMPNCPGLGDFKGQVLHTLRWPQELGVEQLRGKQVLVVGNGCSGAQLVTALAQEPEIQVIALSKSHQWILPSPTRNGPHSTKYTSRQQSFHQISLFLWFVRLITWCKLEINYAIFRPGAVSLRAMIGKKAGGWMRKRAPPEIKDQIVPSFRKTAIIQRKIVYSAAFGAKRVVCDGGYLSALNRENVTPVWDYLASASVDQVVTGTGRTFAPDVIALATGFDLKYGLDVRGRDGNEIHGDRSHIRGYHGSVMPGFPNWFQMLGPNVAPGHFSVAFYLEVQANYISDCIVAMRKYGIDALEVKQSATDKYNQWLDKRLEKSIWGTAKHYYRADGGTGRVWTHFPGSATLFWWINRTVKWDDFIGAEAVARQQRIQKRMVTFGLLAVASAIVWRFTI